MTQNDGTLANVEDSVLIEFLKDDNEHLVPEGDYTIILSVETQDGTEVYDIPEPPILTVTQEIRNNAAYNPSPLLGELQIKINEANALVNVVIESPDGYNVAVNSKFATPSAVASIKAAIEAAKIVAIPGSSEEELSAAKTKIENAITTFNAAVQTVTEQLYFKVTTIKDAETFLASAEISDSSTVENNENWVLQTQYDAFATAIRDAKIVANKSGATDEEIEAAKLALENAKNIYDADIKANAIIIQHVKWNADPLSIAPIGSIVADKSNIYANNPYPMLKIDFDRAADTDLSAFKLEVLNTEGNVIWTDELNLPSGNNAKALTVTDHTMYWPFRNGNATDANIVRNNNIIITDPGAYTVKLTATDPDGNPYVIARDQIVTQTDIDNARYAALKWAGGEDSNATLTQSEDGVKGTIQALPKTTAPGHEALNYQLMQINYGLFENASSLTFEITKNDGTLIWRDTKDITEIANNDYFTWSYRDAVTPTGIDSRTNSGDFTRYPANDADDVDTHIVNIGTELEFAITAKDDTSNPIDQVLVGKYTVTNMDTMLASASEYTLDKIIEALKAEKFTLTQEEGSSSGRVKGNVFNKVRELLNKLEITGVTYNVTITDFTPAVADTSDGSFELTIDVTKAGETKTVVFPDPIVITQTDTKINTEAELRTAIEEMIAEKEDTANQGAIFPIYVDADSAPIEITAPLVIPERIKLVFKGNSSMFNQTGYNHIKNQGLIELHNLNNLQTMIDATAVYTAKIPEASRAKVIIAGDNLTLSEKITVPANKILNVADYVEIVDLGEENGFTINVETGAVLQVNTLRMLRQVLNADIAKGVEPKPLVGNESPGSNAVIEIVPDMDLSAGGYLGYSEKQALPIYEGLHVHIHRNAKVAFEDFASETAYVYIAPGAELSGVIIKTINASVDIPPTEEHYDFDPYTGAGASFNAVKDTWLYTGAYFGTSVFQTDPQVVRSTSSRVEFEKEPEYYNESEFDFDSSNDYYEPDFVVPDVHIPDVEDFTADEEEIFDNYFEPEFDWPELDTPEFEMPNFDEMPEFEMELEFSGASDNNGTATVANKNMSIIKGVSKSLTKSENASVVIDEHDLKIVDQVIDKNNFVPIRDEVAQTLGNTDVVEVEKTNKKDDSLKIDTIVDPVHVPGLDELIVAIQDYEEEEEEIIKKKSIGSSIISKLKNMWRI
ncbi:hypothetical protein AN643_01910 [Candidatus Epulonipiscioides saccharophilum]|nr:hypothetical protein AN643_01910 [Epulopiscium sp. SCG-B10WGA-EpuloB]